LISINEFTPKKPLIAECLKNIQISPSEPFNETRHIELIFPPKSLHWLEGQSVGIIPPGFNEKGRNHRPRLYSIASSRYGEHNHEEVVSLCVKRVSYRDTAGHWQKGIASNYLCDLNPGDPVNLSGPLGRNFLLEPKDYQNYVFLATGTGIAPFRSFLHNVFTNGRCKLPYSKIWLILGVRTKASRLYLDELKWLSNAFPNNFAVDFVMSREEINAQGGHKYISDFVQEHGEIFAELAKASNTNVYQCGIKGMEKGVERCMQHISQKHNFNWQDLKKDLVKQKRWMAEVY
jgi:ferredoxin--NADP+ reductase